MNRYVAAILISGILLGSTTGCGSRDIGKDRATQIALEDAGVAEADITRLTVSKDRDDGRAQYDIKFTYENTEYEYEVLASNGNILGMGMEKINQNNLQGQQVGTEQPGSGTEAGINQESAQSQQDNTQSQQESAQSQQDNTQSQQESAQGQQNSAQSQQANTEQSGNAGKSSANGNNTNQANSRTDGMLTQDEAAKLALDRVPGSAMQDLKIELDYDDGYYKYEGDIIYNRIEYEFEIDAYTGTFLEWSEERR